MIELKQVFDVVYPLQLQLEIVHFRDVKRKLMKLSKLNRWEFDDAIFRLHKETFDGNVFAFCLGWPGWNPGSRLNFISKAKRGEETTIQNSYCYIYLDKRNIFVQKLIKGCKLRYCLKCKTWAEEITEQEDRGDFVYTIIRCGNCQTKLFSYEKEKPCNTANDVTKT